MRGRGPAIVLGNEFLDCLPVRQAIRRGDDWHERMIGLDADEAFVFVLSDANLERYSLSASNFPRTFLEAALTSRWTVHRYGIRPTDLAEELTSNPKVTAHACFLASLGGAAERLSDSRALVCFTHQDRK